MTTDQGKQGGATTNEGARRDRVTTAEGGHQGRDEFANMPHYSRRWTFDPYHQNLVFARQHAPARVEVDTEWTDWEVFQQDRRGEHHHHVGSVHAPDAEYALVLAKENFARRGACVNLWVVEGADIHATAYQDEAVFAHTTDKSYREPAGYQGLRKTMIHGRGPHESERAAAEDVDDHG